MPDTYILFLKGSVTTGAVGACMSLAGTVWRVQRRNIHTRTCLRTRAHNLAESPAHKNPSPTRTHTSEYTRTHTLAYTHTYTCLNEKIYE